MLLNGHVAVVTGGASGIGKASSHRLAEAGASVVVADINKAGAEEVAADIRATGGIALPFEIDIADEARIAAMMAFAKDEFGLVSILHNNAGPVVLLATHDRDLINLDAGMWDKAMAVALRGPMLCCKHVIPQMIERGDGAIINTASIAGIRGGHYLMTHQSSKGGLLALTRGVATRHGKDGIRCNAVLPGFIETPAYESMPKLTRETILRHTMSKRGGVPDDIARLVVFLASDYGSYINGAEIPVDGGYSCHEPVSADFQEMEATGSYGIRPPEKSAEA